MSHFWDFALRMNERTEERTNRGHLVQYRFAMVGISGNGPGWKLSAAPFVGQPFHKNNSSLWKAKENQVFGTFVIRFLSTINRKDGTIILQRKTR